MESQAEIRIGKNKTGTMMSPIDSVEAMEGAEELSEVSPGYSTAIGENRILYMQEAEPVGTLPMPATMKGMLSGLQQKMTIGKQTLLDKLGERIAFERTGTRLYEALISKYEGTEDKSSLPSLDLIEQFYEEELLHFLMVSDIMTEVGGDPTAITPAANVAAVASQGWVQVITDPRTTFAQALDVILMAELVDNAGWDLLISLAQEAGLNEISDQFQRALEEEDVHLATVEQWVQQLAVSGRTSLDSRINQ